MKARYRAMVARTPAEREAVDWSKVLADVGAGIKTDFIIPINGDDYTTPWTSDVINYLSFDAWQQPAYFIFGMADTSGTYQKWLARPVADRMPYFDMDGDGTDDPVLVRTPDKRYPQGETLEEQMCNVGTIFVIPEGDCDDDGKPDWFGLQGNNWARPDRGTWRWSYYFNYDLQERLFDDAKPYPEIPMAEMRLLAAEAHYHLDQLGAAADSINVSRVAAGLNPTDASGTNTSCVPRLPDGSCGDLFEMLKWEKWMETQFRGPYGAPWYFDGRGWGDLYIGTPLQFPMPAKELQGLGLPRYTFGGKGGESASPGSIYKWPHES